MLYNKTFGNLQQLAEDFGGNIERIGENSTFQQVAEKSLSPIFNIPWGHHMLLIDRVQWISLAIVINILQCLIISYTGISGKTDYGGDII